MIAKGFRLLAVAALLAVLVMLPFAGNAAAQSGGTGSVPIAPSGLTAAYAATTGYVVLEWTPGENLPAGYSQQVAQRDASVTPPEWSAWVVSDTATSFNLPSAVGGFLPGKTYVFQVGALISIDPPRYGTSNKVSLTIPAPQSAAKEGSSAQQQAATPPPATAEPAAPASPPAQRNPSALSASVSNGVVTLTWTPGTDSRIVRQVVKRREPRKGWTNVEVSVSANSYTDATAQSGKRYIYRIQGQRSNGRGGISNVARVTVR